MPDKEVVVRSEEQIAEIEAVNKAYRIDWRYPNHQEHIRALCQIVRALRDLVYVPKILPDDDEVTYQEQAERLLREKVDLQSRLKQVERERDRLLRGDFTAEEFQNLCHNTDIQAGFDAFANGCEAYQEKMFGRCRKGTAI